MLAQLPFDCRSAYHTSYDGSQRNAGTAGMGSTLVAALVRDNALCIAHVGDSRIYMLRQGAIQQLTQDHSLVMEQLRRGYITQEEAERSTNQHIILRALGSEEEVQPDVEDLVVLAGDLVLMTSDGLTKYVREEEILQMVSSAETLEAACDALIQSARRRGGDDNITCLLLKIVERPWYKKVAQRWFSGGPPWQNSI